MAVTTTYWQWGEWGGVGWGAHERSKARARPVGQAAGCAAKPVGTEASVRTAYNSLGGARLHNSTCSRMRRAAGAVPPLLPAQSSRERRGRRRKIYIRGEGAAASYSAIYKRHFERPRRLCRPKQRPLERIGSPTRIPLLGSPTRIPLLHYQT